MTPQQPIVENPSAAGQTVPEAVVQLDSIAAQLMAVQRHWGAPDRDAHLAVALDASRKAWHTFQTALAQGVLTLPLEAQHNLLILSVYADSKISKCEAIPSAETLGSLIELTRTLAASLKEWRVAA